MTRLVRLVPVALVLAGTTLLAASGESATCEDLAKLTLPNATIDSVRLVAPGAFSPPGADGRGRGNANQAFANLPAFCRVALTSKPSTDSDIKIEVWMPQSGWNGKFQGSVTADGPASSATRRWLPRSQTAMPRRAPMPATSATAQSSRWVTPRNLSTWATARFTR